LPSHTESKSTALPIVLPRLSKEQINFFANEITQDPQQITAKPWAAQTCSNGMLHSSQILYRKRTAPAFNNAKKQDDNKKTPTTVKSKPTQTIEIVGSLVTIAIAGAFIMDEIEFKKAGGKKFTIPSNQISHDNCPDIKTCPRSQALIWNQISNINPAIRPNTHKIHRIAEEMTTDKFKRWTGNYVISVLPINNKR
jgi:hypothetical protein